MPRDADRSHLHPALREKLVALDSALEAKHIPLALFEGARSPNRQVELYAQGRGTGATGHFVTKARAWESFHQYGLAVDYVFKIGLLWGVDLPVVAQRQRRWRADLGAGADAEPGSWGGHAVANHWSVLNPQLVDPYVVDVVETWGGEKKVDHTFRDGRYCEEGFVILWKGYEPPAVPGFDRDGLWRAVRA
jgi:hypothetical protein